MMLVGRMYTTRYSDIVFTNKQSQTPLHLDIVTSRWHRKDDCKPVAIFVHGGGWIIGSKNADLMTSDLPAILGWVSVCVQYRCDHCIDTCACWYD